MVQTVTCIGALHPKSMFIKLPTTQYRYDQWFKLLLRAYCPSGKTLIYLWGKPEPSRKQSQTLNMNLEGQRLDKNILIQVLNKWQLNFYQLFHQNIRPKVTKCTGMLRCRLRMIPLSGNQERIKGDREGITHTHPIPSVIRLELFWESG